MSSLVQRTNADGLVVRYGVEDAVTGRVRYANGKVEEELVIDFTYSDVTAAAGTGFYDADASGGETPDSFSDAIPFIPGGSVITECYLFATVAWAGTATIDIGFETKAGAAIDADALFNGLDVDSATVGLATVGAMPVPEGVAVFNGSAYDPDWHDSSGSTTADMYIRVINADAGTLTAGEARLVVKYIAP